MQKIKTENCKKLTVHFIGGEGISWALDEDLFFAISGLPDFVKLTTFLNADVIYSVWPGALENISPQKLEGKIVICEFDNPPYYYIKQPSFHKIRQLVSLWVTHTQEASDQAQILGLKFNQVSYRLSGDTFLPVDSKSKKILSLRSYYKIPKNVYVIGNFHRDSDGSNLQYPKYQKGPDVFFQIIFQLKSRNLPIHILIAGPRRHWLRSQLDKFTIPYTFVGKKIKGEDIKQNILPRKQLNQLYACLDLVLVTSRWEGGPYSILEGAATKRKVLSSRVGIAGDLLEPSSIYDSPDEAVKIINQDISRNILAKTIQPQYKRYLLNHTLPVAKRAMLSVFKMCYEVPTLNSKVLIQAPEKSKSLHYLTRAALALGFKKINYSQKTISIFREFHKPPYGGGNQFMLALKGEFEKLGIRVLNNEVGHFVDAYLFDSIWFDLKLLKKLDRVD